MSHRIQKTWKDHVKSVVPFGIGLTKPKHFRDMAKVVWANRDNLPYAWKVLSRGVCDGCALGVAGFHDWTIKGVHLCMTRLNLLRLNTMPALDIRLLEDISKIQSLPNDELRELGRLPFPLLRTKGDKGFRRIGWDEAYQRIAARIRKLEPKRIGFFVTSRGVTNEIYYMAQKVARFLGTNNVDNAARLCHSPSTGAMKYGLGVAATTCSYKDWWGTDLIIFFGANPANDQPVTTKYLHEAKQCGTKIVVVNPYREPGMERYWVPSTAKSALFGTDIMDYWFPVSQGGDIAFLYGIIKLLIENNWYDSRFVDPHTTGFEELKVQALHLDWPTIERQAGLPRSSMLEFAELIRNARTAVLVWSMGITQHRFGGDAVSMILNLGLLKGFVGRDKCGLMPIRGHSSVQGGAEMGAYSTVFPGGKSINAENARLLAQEYQFPVPDWTGLTTTEMVEAGARGELDLLYCLGGNFLRTLPDPDYVAHAMANIPLRVHQDIILTDQMFIEPKEEVILLPAKTRYEQDDGGTETITERRIVFTPEIPRQVGEAKAEWKILRELAAVVSPERASVLGCETGWQMREEIARIVPFYNGVQYLKRTGDAIQYGGSHLCAGWKFPTSDGKAHFRTVPLPQIERAGGVFEVSTRRGKQFNTLIYDDVDPMTGAARDAIFINPEDAAELHLVSNDAIVLVSVADQSRTSSGREGEWVSGRTDGIAPSPAGAPSASRFKGRVFLAPIARGNLQVFWPEGNVLLQTGVVDVLGGVPDYNAQVRIEKLNGKG